MLWCTMHHAHIQKMACQSFAFTFTYDTKHGQLMQGSRWSSAAEMAMALNHCFWQQLIPHGHSPFSLAWLSRGPLQLDAAPG